MAHMWKKAQASQSQAFLSATGAAPAHSLLANTNAKTESRRIAADVGDADADADAEGESDADMASSTGRD